MLLSPPGLAAAVVVVVVVAATSFAAPGMPDSHPTWSVAQMEPAGHH